MNNPCKDCKDKVEDEWGLFCDLSCGKNTAWVSYRAGMEIVVEWCENNFEPTVPMSLDYHKWHNQLKEWRLQEG